MSKIIIVNELDELIGVKNSGEILPSDIYRVSALWLTNSKGEILLAQRGFQKRNSPGKWSVAVAGTVEDGETYDSNIVKEIREEIGLSNLSLRKGPKFMINGEHRYFVQFFLAQCDVESSELVIAKPEVADVKWFTKDEIKHLLQVQPDLFTFSFPNYFSALA